MLKFFDFSYYFIIRDDGLIALKHFSTSKNKDKIKIDNYLNKLKKTRQNYTFIRILFLSSWLDCQRNL